MALSRTSRNREGGAQRRMLERNEMPGTGKREDGVMPACEDQTRLSAAGFEFLNATTAPDRSVGLHYDLQRHIYAVRDYAPAIIAG
ncbi:MAG: hypothetical protein ACR2LV_05820 [Solirubrobacteraceae bacterium]